MKTIERLDRIEISLEKQSQNLDKLSQVTGAIAASVAAHDGQIENLIRVAEKQQKEWEHLRREWQAT